MIKYLLATLLLVSTAFAEQPEAERALIILQQLQIPISQAEVAVEVKKEIIGLQKTIDELKKKLAKNKEKER